MFSERKDNDKVKELEKRIEELEKQLDNDVKELKEKTKEQIKDIGASFRMLKEVMERMQDDKSELERDRNFLIEKHKELIRYIPVDRSRLKRDIREKLLMPLRRQVKENTELIRDAALEGLTRESEGAKPAEKVKKGDYFESIKTAVVGDETKTPIDEMFELVMKQNSLRVADAARKFGVTEAQIEEWAKILEGHGLVEMHYPPIGKPEIRKKTQDE